MRHVDTAMDDFNTGIDGSKPEEPTDEELSRLSAVQALRDFEVANGRVIDLTGRLVITAEELLTARQELEEVRAERDELRSRLHDLSAQHEALLTTHERTLARKSVQFGEAIWAARRSIASRRRDD